VILGQGGDHIEETTSEVAGQGDVIPKEVGPGRYFPQGWKFGIVRESPAWLLPQWIGGGSVTEALGHPGGAGLGDDFALVADLDEVAAVAGAGVGRAGRQVDFNWCGLILWSMIAAMKLRMCLLPGILLLGGCATQDVVAPVAAASMESEGAVKESLPAEKPAEAAKPEPRVIAAPIGSIEITELFGLVESGGVLLYDVRPPFVQTLGRIPGAVGMPRKKFDERIGDEEPRMKQAVATGRSVVLYCANLKCPDADAVAAALSRRGIATKVYHAGWEEWKAADLPTE